VAERGFLLINPRSGGGAHSPDELQVEARKRGIETHVLERGDDAVALARAADADAVGIAGGDGSLALVAAVALERELPLVCIPFGTRNHFARDLGLDIRDPVRCLDGFDGEERAVDVGRVGDRLFLNNVSIGLYAGLVHVREKNRLRRGILATARALLISAYHRPDQLRIDDRTCRGRIVLASNNEYDLSLFTLGERERLDEGRVYLYIAEGVVPTEWDVRSGDAFRLDSDSAEVQAAIDGEPVTLKTPVELRVEPGALRVLVAGEPGA